jgi:hypothetical protein
VLENWGYVEADFQREYHIDLSKELTRMGWRRFKTLLRGLSTNSLWYQICNSKQDVIDDPDEAERAVNAVWK